MFLKNIQKKLWIAAGIICFILAVAAYIIPLIPTPPFIAGALYCFARGSHRFHDWLLYKTTFGKYFQMYRHRKIIPKKIKIGIISILILGAAFSCIFVFTNWWLRGIMLFFVTITVVFLIASKSSEE